MLLSQLLHEDFLINEIGLHASATVQIFTCWGSIHSLTTAYPRMVREATRATAGGREEASATRGNGGCVVRHGSRRDGEEHSEIRQGTLQGALSGFCALVRTHSTSREGPQDRS